MLAAHGTPVSLAWQEPIIACEEVKELGLQQASESFSVLGFQSFLLFCCEVRVHALKIKFKNVGILSLPPFYR